MILVEHTLRPRFCIYQVDTVIRSTENRSMNHVWSFQKLAVSTWFVNRSLCQRNRFARALSHKAGLRDMSSYR